MGPGRDPSLLLELPFESSQVQYQAVVRGVLELPGVQGNQDDRHGPLSLVHTRVLASLSPRGDRWGSTLQGGYRGWCRWSAGKRLQRRGRPSRQHCSQPPPQRGCFPGRLNRDYEKPSGKCIQNLSARAHKSEDNGRLSQLNLINDTTLKLVQKLDFVLLSSHRYVQFTLDFAIIEDSKCSHKRVLHDFILFVKLLQEQFFPNHIALYL